MRHFSAVSSCKFSARTLGLAETQHVLFTAQKLNVYPFKTNFKRYYGISEVGLYIILANGKYISCYSLKASDLLWLTYPLLIGVSCHLSALRWRSVALTNVSVSERTTNQTLNGKRSCLSCNSTICSVDLQPSLPSQPCPPIPTHHQHS